MSALKIEYATDYVTEIHSPKFFVGKCHLLTISILGMDYSVAYDTPDDLEEAAALLDKMETPYSVQTVELWLLAI